MSPSAGSAPLELRVATLNLRNLADRWDERLPLLLADFGNLIFVSAACADGDFQRILRVYGH